MAVKIDLPRNLHGNRLHVVYAHEGDRKPLSTIKACLKCSTAAANQCEPRSSARTVAGLQTGSEEAGLVYANELYERNQVQYRHTYEKKTKLENNSKQSILMNSC